MSAPLYQGHGADRSRPNHGHTGLWYTRFFDRFDSTWEVPKEAKPEWISHVEGTCGDHEALARACLRQLELVRSLDGQNRAFAARWHFATGLGLPHPVENGFTWHPTLGVPFICGAAVKGLVKAWVETMDELPEEAKTQQMNDWFGDQDGAGKLIFFDAIPAAPPLLTADVMTPHLGDWYQKGDTISDPAREAEKLPADWHDPVPVPFLVVRKATFLFALAPRSPEFREFVSPAMEVLERALDELGAGAKTAVGYGRMSQDVQTLDRLTAQQAEIEQELEKERRLGAMSPFERSIEERIAQWPDLHPHVVLCLALADGFWEGDEARRVAAQARELMEASRKWRPESKKGPKKDKDHGRTLQLLKLLNGSSE